MTAKDLIHHLEGPGGLSLADLDALSETELMRLASALHHWHELAELRIGRRRAAKEPPTD